jgi:hypothetical protein
MNATCYATCNGQTVQIKAVGYLHASDFTRYGLTEIPVKNERYITASGGGKPPVYAYLAGRCECGAMHFVERRIERPNAASNHKCDGRCMNSKGRKCECSCKGKNHGSN